jgi:hypothetical protein
LSVCFHWAVQAPSPLKSIKHSFNILLALSDRV